jgi:hypothetical protein
VEFGGGTVFCVSVVEQALRMWRLQFFSTEKRTTFESFDVFFDGTFSFLGISL